jgi:hypothetical protein
MNRVFIPMSTDNIQKILNGEKTTTTRSKRSSEQIGMFVGETCVTSFNGTDFFITNRGLLNIEEAGGKEKMLMSEAFGENGPMFKQTVEWLDGIGKLYVYDINKLDESF